MDIRSQLKKKEDKIRAYYGQILNSTTDSKIISNYARKSYKIQKSRKAIKSVSQQLPANEQRTKKGSSHASANTK